MKKLQNQLFDQSHGYISRTFDNQVYFIKLNEIIRPKEGVKLKNKLF